MSEKQKKLIIDLIDEYYEYSGVENKPEYAMGYAEATLNMIRHIIDTVQTGLE